MLVGVGDIALMTSFEPVAGLAFLQIKKFSTTVTGRDNAAN